MARAENGFGFVDEKERQMSFGRFFAALREQVPNLAFRLSEPHVENFRPLHAEEELGMILTGLLADLEP